MALEAPAASGTALFSCRKGAAMEGRCRHCSGNMVFEPHAGDGDLVGFEYKCMMCGRVQADVPVQRLALIMGVPISRLARMEGNSWNSVFPARARHLIRRVVDYLADERG